MWILKRWYIKKTKISTKSVKDEEDSKENVENSILDIKEDLDS